MTELNTSATESNPRPAAPRRRSTDGAGTATLLALAADGPPPAPQDAPSARSEPRASGAGRPRSACGHDAPAVPGPSRQPIRVLVVADRDPIRSAIDGVLSGDRAITVSGSTASRAVETATREGTQVAIVDYDLEDGDALAACVALKALRAPPRVLLLSVALGDLLPVLAAIAGADGTIGRGGLGDNLRAAVRDVHLGRSIEAVVSPSTLPELAPGELRLMSLLLYGATPSEAGTQLGISTPAVELRRQSLLARLRERDQGDRRRSPLEASTHEAPR